MRNAAAAGYNWWINELIDTFPEAVRRWVSLGGQQIFIRFDTAGLVQVQSSSHSEQLDIPIDEYGSAEKAGRQISNWLRSNRIKASGIAIFLPGERVLNPVFEIPSEAANSLQEISLAEIEKQTPFAAAQVYHRIRVIEASSDLDTISVRLTIARIEDVEHAVAVAMAANISDVVVCGEDEPDPMSSNLAPTSRKSGFYDFSRWGKPALIFVILALLAIAMHLPLERMRQVNALADTKIAELKSLNTSHQLSGSQSELLKDVYVGLINRKSTDPLQLDLLSEITRRTPDHSWLVQLQIDNSQLVLSGFSSDANDLIRSLEKSELMQNVAFSAPVTTDNRLGVDRVYIRAERPDQKDGQ